MLLRINVMCNVMVIGNNLVQLVVIVNSILREIKTTNVVLKVHKWILL
jgi:hypothetical protein